MSRGGRGGRGGGRGGFGGGGRGGFGAGNLPPMGLTFADIQSMSREQSALYPAVEVLPVLTEYSDAEKAICERQIGFAIRLKTSRYYITEHTKSTELERYSDKYRPSTGTRPTLKRKELHQPFFPQDVFEGYFNPKKRRKGIEKKSSSKRVNLDDLGDDLDDPDKSDADRSDVGSQAAEEDYDVDEEYDNDYAENYFDNGEGDDMDDLGGGGGGDEGGGTSFSC
ncbi:hypothetical protein HETIRDRAFT_325316 [Heterobasidion irregulare TC 32-1]|uniref:DNA-directed RNA polymerase III subunit n=1 Tax=Heterobasidion irregulare (strain TC 32-1) TaxID=747525 RepID=W4JYA9_HETIT|nr:uncharacterized protein HETIRDRAFT_325316 [Heterobasidion irregulare TC 32-1]ETW78090.1 hypothetical protein HETIRDRAFT_325316 [Heterobasidion irregulare TC 32-1]